VLAVPRSEKRNDAEMSVGGVRMQLLMQRRAGAQQSRSQDGQAEDCGKTTTAERIGSLVSTRYHCGGAFRIVRSMASTRSRVTAMSPRALLQIGRGDRDDLWVVQISDRNRRSVAFDDRQLCPTWDQRFAVTNFYFHVRCDRGELRSR
jgi:hypothetical protein